MQIRSDLDVKNLKIVVFDWDNTLAESRTALVYAVNKVLQEYGLQDWETEKQKRDNNLSFKDNFANIFGPNAQEAYQKYRKKYLEITEKLITTFPKTHEVLSFLRKEDVSLMIMSNKERALLEYELPFLFNPETFDNIVCGHEAKNDKPHADHLFWTLKNVMKQEQINKDNVWVIGDSPQDSKCALSAGARAIRIGTPIWDDDDKQDKNICFFDSFVDFYESLLLSNAK